MSDKSVGRRTRPWEALPEAARHAWADRLPDLVEEIIAAIRVEVPAYAKPLRGVFGERVRVGVEQALATFDPSDAPVRRDVYVALGRGEARAGRSLEALLAAYRVGAMVTWRGLAQAAVDAELDAATLVLLAESIFAYIDELSASSAEGFASERAALDRVNERRREALVALLVRPEPTSSGVLEAAAAQAGWALPQAVAILAWPADAPSPALGRLPSDSLRGSVAGRLTVVVGDPDAPGRRAEIARAVGGATVGLGHTVAPVDASQSHRRALAALDLAADDGRHGLVVAADHLATLVLRADPAVTADLAAARLRPLADETAGARRRLEDTLLAWLRHDGNATTAAAELVVHPQTVRYRLARLRELFGDDLDDPDVRFELQIALRHASPGSSGRCRVRPR